MYEWSASVGARASCPARHWLTEAKHVAQQAAVCHVVGVRAHDGMRRHSAPRLRVRVRIRQRDWSATCGEGRTYRTAHPGLRYLAPGPTE